MSILSLNQYLDALVPQFEQRSFIDDDPVSVPHAFEDPRDQEVIGLFAALLAWGRRETVLSKMADLCERVRYRPYQFFYDFGDSHAADRLSDFRHRTFQPTDALWLARALSAVLRRYGSLEKVFSDGMTPESEDVGAGIQHFSDTILGAVPGMPARTAKHVARPESGSACKRLSMYLRWMVRPGPVDFGIWKRIRPSQLVLPLDVHSGRSARTLGLLTRRQNDWKAAMELTRSCRQLCAEDPCRYDYVFFGVGAQGITLEPPQESRSLPPIGSKSVVSATDPISR